MRHVDQTKRNNKVKFLYHEHYQSWHWHLWWKDDIADVEKWYRKDNHLRCYRRINTTHERRWSLAYEEANEYGCYVRGKRSKRSLPNTWDDICIGSHNHGKSWKKNSKRKKQWKYK